MEILSDLIVVSSKINKYFNDEEKTTIWLNTKNPLLGNQKPVDMIFAGRTDKLNKFINSQLDEQK